MKKLPNGLVEHNLPKPVAVGQASVLVDVGPGIRPMNWYKPDRHICVEPCKAYADVLRAAGYPVAEVTGQRYFREAIERGKHFDGIYMLDVVEHLHRSDAEQMMLDAQFCLVPGGQLVIYTPIGLTDNGDEDHWGLGEWEKWQTHRCGFLPSDRFFDGWHIEKYAKGFFGIYTA